MAQVFAMTTLRKIFLLKNINTKTLLRVSFQKKEIDYFLSRFTSFVLGDFLLEFNAFEKAKMRLMVKSLGPESFFNIFLEE